MLKIESGNWVRYYCGGKLVIGVVQYIRPKRSDFYEPEVCTDVGTCSIDEVIEVRSGRGIETIEDPYYLNKVREATEPKA